MLNIAVTGSEGRVGQCVVQIVNEDKTAKLVQALNREALHNFSQTAKTPQTQIDVIIDFTQPTATLALLPICCQQNYCLVIGTTGFTDSEKQFISDASKTIPIVFAPNMSIGINISYKLMELTAQALKAQHPDIAILDIHHKHKKDAPSGTALRMGELIAETQGKSLVDSNIEFSALRLADSLGEHVGLFAWGGEQIEIRHRSMNRFVYAKGALQAAKWLIDKKPGLYTMQDVLGL